MLQALNILEGFDLRTLGHNTPAYLHVLTEAFKLAFADRYPYITDPRFAPVARTFPRTMRYPSSGATVSGST